MKNKFYITTTLPYVNAEPHIGFALEIIQADVLARYHRTLGEDVVFNFGTDEHGQKIYIKAKEQGKDPQKYCDEYAVKFEALKKALNLSYTNFIRTTDKYHIEAAQAFWLRCVKNGDIYKKNYKVKYCIGSELEKTDSELNNGKCPLHPNADLELREEENYFFRFSKYQQVLLEMYNRNSSFVVPSGKLKEIETFVKSGLEDFSVSRLKAKMPWGIDVPNDPEHVMYVWFDALINYISTLGWPNNVESFENYWPGLQVAGKDNLRQQSAMWQAMLMSAELECSKQIFIHGFLTVNGQKISKSLGNAINPIQVVERYGTDALRYFLLAKVHPWEDSDFSLEKFEEACNADLANGIGNVVARVARLAEQSGFEFEWEENKGLEPDGDVGAQLRNFRFDLALFKIWGADLQELDRHIDQEKPWTKSDDDLRELLNEEVRRVRLIAEKIKPFLPETSEKILDQFGGAKIKSGPPLFPRIKKA